MRISDWSSDVCSSDLPVTVDITVNDDAADDGNQFSPGETGSVKVSATFGDTADGSETHTVLVEIPDGFTVVEPLPASPAGLTAAVTGDGALEITVAKGTPGFTDDQRSEESSVGKECVGKGI